MNILVDTCIWSLALRRSQQDSSPPTRELLELITEGRACVIGPIRQELLSGIRNEVHFHKLREALRAFPDLALERDDFERAADYCNICRRQGVQGSNTDFLICAVAERLRLSILTTDRDFRRFAEFLPILLHEPRSGLSS